MDSKGRHIQLIEDDPAVANSLRQRLKGEGFQVTWRSSGWERRQCLFRLFPSCHRGRNTAKYVRNVLGVPSIKSIVVAHHGKIKVESTK